jgi:hypothetical protein
MRLQLALRLFKEILLFLGLVDQVDAGHNQLGLHLRHLQLQLVAFVPLPLKFRFALHQRGLGFGLLFCRHVGLALPQANPSAIRRTGCCLFACVRVSASQSAFSFTKPPRVL